MKILINDDFDLQKIADSGQCFRFNKCADNTYRTVAFGKVLTVKECGKNEYDFDCTKKEYETVWKSYFDLDEENKYSNIRKMVKDDAFLKECAKYGEGIRILRQDKWEMLISFIISQRKSIPAIKTSIERLCKACGDRINNENYAFPTPAQILNCDSKKLEECGLGYRLPYILNAADLLFNNISFFDDLEKIEDDEMLLEELKKLHGVGVKVASCVALFGFHRLNHLPIDVWMKRAFDEKYPKGFDMEKYKPYNGVIQQYIFFYYRATHM